MARNFIKGHEAAFEGFQCIAKYEIDLSKYQDKTNISSYSTSYSKYRKKYPNDKKRLIAICENIIANKGKFIY